MRRPVSLHRIMVLPSTASSSCRIAMSHLWWASLLLVLNVLTMQVDGAHVFQSYRVAQFDRGTALFGSRRATLNHIASALGTSSGKEDLIRRIVVVKAQQLSRQLVRDVALVRKASGLLVLLPQNFNQSGISSASTAEFRAVERTLLEGEFDLPIYFSFEDEQLVEVYESIEHPSLGQSVGENYQFVASASEAALVGSLTAYNFQVCAIHLASHFPSFAHRLPLAVTGMAAS